MAGGTKLAFGVEALAVLCGRCLDVANWVGSCRLLELGS